jgi:hypothetical protein
VSRSAFVAVVSAGIVVAFGATWFISSPATSGDQAGKIVEPASPISQAASWQLQCYAPNRDKKTCQSLAGYAKGEGGEIENTAMVMVSASPLVVMETVSPVTVRADQVCGAVRTRDIETADFTVDGLAAAPRQATNLRKRMLTAMRRFLGKKICTSYTPEGESLLATASVDGVPDPSLSQRVVWVSPADGYTVGP